MELLSLLDRVGAMGMDTDATFEEPCNAQYVFDTMLTLGCPQQLNECNQGGDVASSMSLSHTGARNQDVSTPMLKPAVKQRRTYGSKGAPKSVGIPPALCPPTSKTISSKETVSDSMMDSVMESRMDSMVDIDMVENHPRNKESSPKKSRVPRKKRATGGARKPTTTSKNKKQSGVSGTTVGNRRKRGPTSKSSKYKGVTYYKRTGRWEAHIWESGRQLYLGASASADMAARAYDRAVLRFRGIDAQLNFEAKNYLSELPKMHEFSKRQLVLILRRQSLGKGSLNPTYTRVTGSLYSKASARRLQKESCSSPAVSFEGNTQVAGEIDQEMHHTSSTAITQCNPNACDGGPAFVGSPAGVQVAEASAPPSPSIPTQASQAPPSPSISTQESQAPSSPTIPTQASPASTPGSYILNLVPYGQPIYVDPYFMMCYHLGLIHNANETQKKINESPVKLSAMELKAATQAESLRYERMVAEILQNSRKH